MLNFMKKKIKLQILSVFGNVLFEYEAVDNTIAKTVTQAVKSSANLSYANLISADLRYANLSYADLRSADLRSANLSSADLRSADLSYAKNFDLAVAMTRILPEGEIIGWKKARDNKIIKLLIPKDAKRSHAFGRKCRSEKAIVLEIWDGKKKSETANSIHKSDFIYEVGKTIIPLEKFDENWTEECSDGIHFYITKLEAENHS